MRLPTPLPATDMLRALPPNAALRSHTVTAKPRSASSCAALSLLTPSAEDRGRLLRCHAYILSPPKRINISGWVGPLATCSVKQSSAAKAPRAPPATTWSNKEEI